MANCLPQWPCGSVFLKWKTQSSCLPHQDSSQCSIPSKSISLVVPYILLHLCLQVIIKCLLEHWESWRTFWNIKKVIIRWLLSPGILSTDSKSVVRNLLVKYIPATVKEFDIHFYIFNLSFHIFKHKITWCIICYHHKI